TCKISGCLSYRILDSGPDGTQTTLTENLAQLDALTKQLRSRSNSLEAIPSQVVLSGEIKVEGEIRTLAQLFALEYQKIKQGED
ncbi:hypothetical protein R9J58_01290, partial [Escherichia coli]